MTINEHLTEFAGKPVKDWEQGAKDFDPTGIAYRISVTAELRQAARLSWERRKKRKPTSWLDKIRAPWAPARAEKPDASGEGEEQRVSWIVKFRVFTTQPGVQELEALIVGEWQEPYESESVVSVEIVNSLVEARTALPKLKALFLGDIVSEECEISWIEQTNVLPLLQAYPQLETFAVRGSNHLVVGELEHTGLKSLTIQSGGLPLTVLKDVLLAELPNLEHLELWLGVRDYGWDGTVDDLNPLFAGDLFPKLSYLGLRDSEITDQIAIAIAEAPILRRIQVLDLSLGTLSDEGAAALLTSSAIRQLEKLDVHRHYCSDEVTAQLIQLGNVDASDKKEPDEWNNRIHRYVAVSE